MNVEYYKNKYIGLHNKNIQNLDMEIIEYNSYDNILIKFEDGTIVSSLINIFNNGRILNKNMPEIYDKYFLGYGEYSAKKENGYSTWMHILHRVNIDKNSSDHREKSYIGCDICKEWYNFQNFAKWFKENYYTVNDEKMCIDKDLLIHNNKIYSPKTCIFVPEYINLILAKSKSSRGTLPIGVRSYTSKNTIKYMAYMKQGRNNNRKQISLGIYKDQKSAFMAYKINKENYIKQIANEYKNKIPDKLYNIMYNYQINIDD